MEKEGSITPDRAMSAEIITTSKSRQKRIKAQERACPCALRAHAPVEPVVGGPPSPFNSLRRVFLANCERAGNNVRSVKFSSLYKAAAAGQRPQSALWPAVLRSAAYKHLARPRKVTHCDLGPAPQTHGRAHMHCTSAIDTYVTRTKEQVLMTETARGQTCCACNHYKKRRRT